jgi:outer membrane protein, multidrug efflux system
MKNIIYSTALLLLILSGCKVSKDISLPTAPAPEVFRDATSTDSIGIASIEWKQFFTNQSLLQLIDSAIIHNYDMQLAIKNIEAAQLVANQSKLGYLPTVNLQVSAAINRPSDNSLNGLSLSQFLGKSYVEDYNASAAISWEADIWGKIKNQKARALAAFLQTGEARKTVQTNLVSLVATGYYNLLLLDAQVAIAKRNLTLSDSTLRIIQLQYQAGQVSILGVEQAEAQ